MDFFATLDFVRCLKTCFLLGHLLLSQVLPQPVRSRGLRGCQTAPSTAVEALLLEAFLNCGAW